MSQIAEAGAIARRTQVLLKGAGAQLAGKKRGPDHDPEKKRKVPHRHSYDVDSPEANAKWRRVGDGSVREGIVHREALIEAAEQLQQEQWKATPRVVWQESRRTHVALSAELDAIAAGAASAAIGRPATIRQELAKAAAVLARWRDRLRDVDLKVLRAILRHLDFATGRMFPCEERIAELASCSRGSVVNAKRRLQAHGLLDWVRRTIKTGNAGEFAPQREQTSNAYEFAPVALMASKTRARYLQLLVCKLKRLGAAPAGLAASAARAAARAAQAVSADVAAQREALASLGSAIGNAST